MGHAERLRRLVTMGVLVQLGMSLECCSEGASFWDDLEDPARTPARAGSHAASQLPCLSRRRRCWCLTCAPLPRFPAQAHASCRHLGARIFLFGNLFRRPPAGASPSPPPAGWLRGLRRRPKRAPQHALPPPLSRACGLRVLATYCGLAAHGTGCAALSCLVRGGEHLATCPQKKWVNLRN